MLFLAFELNSEPVKYTILALTAPLWIPFIRALWKTLDDSLREEGGLLGEAPTEEALRELEREHGRVGESMLSEPLGSDDVLPLGANRPRPARTSGTSMGRRRGFR